MINKKKYSYIQIGIASPEEILSWSHGEVTSGETINYRTLKPERGGLFCEVIFGPTKDYTCACGYSKKMSRSDKRCEKCGVDITESKVRRERMGHIALNAPVVHTWFLKNSPSKIATLLDLKSKEVEEIVYMNSYVVFDPKQIEEFAPTYENGEEKKKLLTAQEYARYQRENGINSFVALTGAEAIKRLLHELDLESLSKNLREQLNPKGDKSKPTRQNRDKLVKRLEVVEAFINSGNKPEWMVMDYIPVIPPDLRPMVQLDGGRFATTDLIDLYRHIIVRNKRLKQYEKAPSILSTNEKRNIQQAVDALIDNSKNNKKDKTRPLKSLSDLLRGKQGRFRQNLLGKRVDFSGRSVICVGPDLKMYQCGIPREMGLILFKPFIIHAIIEKYPDNPETGAKMGIRDAKTMIERGDPIAMTELERIIVEHPVLLNRAPTLHRLGIQAFEPKLVEGKAIRLHPLACTAFNADFDGDQMAVHLPLSEEAQTEARLLMLASKNILAPKDGKPIVTPSQDMVLGNYYLTIEKTLDEDPRGGRVFLNPDEVETAYENEQIGFHTRVVIPAISLKERVTRFMPKAIGKDKNPNPENYYIQTTYGKILFNTIFPDMEPYIPYICEFNMDKPSDSKNLTDCVPEKYFIKKGTNIEEYLRKLPLPHPFTKKFLSVIISEVFKKFKLAETSKTLDKMKDLGFRYSTVSGITVSHTDIQLIDTKYEYMIAREAATRATIKKYKKFGIDYWALEFEKDFYVHKPIEGLAVGKLVSENYVIGNGVVITQGKGHYNIISQDGEVKCDTEGSVVAIEEIPGKFNKVFRITIKCKRDYYTDSEDKILVTEGQEIAKGDKIISGGVLVDADIRVEKYDACLKYGLITAEERSKLVQQVWKDTKKDLENDITVQAKRDFAINDLYMMADSGARGSIGNFIQLSGIRGLMAKPNGEDTDIPIKSSFREGLTMSEFFMSSHGSRKGSTDTALKTAESGYLTRRLVDVSQDVIVTEDDCHTDKGWYVTAIYEEGKQDKPIESLKDRIKGRFTSKPILDPQTGKQLFPKDTFITDDIADKIISKKIEGVWIRTLLTCNCKNGVCVHCYGSDLSTGGLVEKGEVVGIIAAQSIGEPGTQLTMRTFHSGGVAGGEDITQGLPRIQELFEAREPKSKALISEIDGVVESIEPLANSDNRFDIKIVNQKVQIDKSSTGRSIASKNSGKSKDKDKDKVEFDTVDYQTDAGRNVIVKVGDFVRAGQKLTDGLIHPKELLKSSTVEEVAKYILKEVLKVYHTQDVDIADKHVEIIIKQMLRKVIILDEGDTNLLPGSEISRSELKDVMFDCIKNGKTPPSVKPELLGITRSSLRSDSFLSAASFQETTRVLTEAAIRGKKDTLEGLKENIIIGGLIPAGTGLAFCDPEIVTDDEEN